MTAALTSSLDMRPMLAAGQLCAAVVAQEPATDNRNDDKRTRLIAGVGGSSCGPAHPNPTTTTIRPWQAPAAWVLVDKLVGDLETGHRSACSARTANCSLVIGEFKLANSRQNTLGAIHGHCAVAAPTAGLHFTPELLKRLEERGVEIAYVTLDGVLLGADRCGGGVRVVRPAV